VSKNVTSRHTYDALHAVRTHYETCLRCPSTRRSRRQRPRRPLRVRPRRLSLRGGSPTTLSRPAVYTRGTLTAARSVGRSRKLSRPECGSRAVSPHETPFGRRCRGPLADALVLCGRVLCHANGLIDATRAVNLLNEVGQLYAAGVVTDLPADRVIGVGVYPGRTAGTGGPRRGGV